MIYYLLVAFSDYMFYVYGSEILLSQMRFVEMMMMR